MNDYFEIYEKDDITPEIYYLNLFEKLNEDEYINYSDLNIVKHYIDKKEYKEFKNIQHIRNDVRRLFLIFFFGSSTQKEYFKNEIKKEFYLIKGKK